MRFFIFFLVSFISTACLALNINVKSGWQLLGTCENGIKVTYFNKAKSLWKFTNGKWQIASPDSSLNEILKFYGISSFDTINSGEGFWSSSNIDFIVNQVGVNASDKVLHIKAGWQLVSLKVCSSIKVDDKFNSQNINTLWKWDNNTWHLFSPKEEIKNLILNYGIPVFDNIEPNEGFWVNASNNVDITFEEKNYTILYFIRESNSLLEPLKYQPIFDKDKNLLGHTDYFGIFKMDKVKTIFLDDDKYSFLPIVIKSPIHYYASVVFPKIILPDNNSSISANIPPLDIGDFWKFNHNIYIAAKPVAKVFWNFSKDFAIIIKEFYANTDITLAVIEDKILSQDNSSILGAMYIELENSFGQSVTPEDVQFSGYFKPVMKISKQIDSDVALFLNDNGTWEYICSAVIKNNKIIASKYINKIGKFAFVKVNRLFNHKITINNMPANSIIVGIDNYDNVFFAENNIIEFKSVDKIVPFTIYSPGYKKEYINLSGDISITLGKDNVSEKCTYFYNAFNGELFKDKKLNMALDNYIFDFLTNSEGKYCFIAPDNISKLKIGEQSYYIKDSLYIIPEYKKLLQTRGITYAEPISFKNYLIFPYNDSTGGYINVYDNSLQKMKEFKLENFYFNSFCLINDNIVFTDLNGNSYSLDENLNFSKGDLSKDDFFEDIGNFVFKGVSNTNYCFFPTTNGYIIEIDKQGNNSGYAPIKVNSANDNSSDDIVSFVKIDNDTSLVYKQEGGIYLFNIDNKTISPIAVSNIMLNYYNTDYKNKNFYYMDNMSVKIINCNNFTMTTLNIQKNYNVLRVIDDFLICSNGVDLDVYTINNLEFYKSLAISGELVNVFERNNFIWMFFRSKIVILSNNLEVKQIIEPGQKIIAVSEINNKFFIKYANGSIYVY